MGNTQEAATSSPADKPLPQEILYDACTYQQGIHSFHFRNPLTLDEAKAVAFDFASIAAGQTSLDQMVVDASDESGIRLHIFSGLENTAHSYTLTTRTSSEPEGPKGELYLKAEPDAGNVGVIEVYKPGAKFAKLLKRANSYEMEGGFVERKPPIQERMYQKGIALGQFAVVWTGFYAMKKAFPEQAPIWLGFLWGAAWCYALLDGVHRIGSNISVWQTKKVEEKEKRLEKRKKSLAHAFSHNGASED